VKELLLSALVWDLRAKRSNIPVYTEGKITDLEEKNNISGNEGYGWEKTHRTHASRPTS
jgi:hypothetical protein